jgi:hypothetical protein
MSKHVKKLPPAPNETDPEDLVEGDIKAQIRRAGRFKGFEVFYVTPGKGRVGFSRLPDDCLVITSSGVFRREIHATMETFTPYEEEGFLRKFEPSLEWTARKLSYEEFGRAVAFLRRVELDMKTEARLDLMFHPQKDEYTWVPPKQVVSRSSIKYTRPPKTYGKYFAEGWRLVGSVHSHPCGLSAFSSGTDHQDELDNNGVHFTVAKMLPGQGGLEVDCRLVVNGKAYKRSYSEFVDVCFGSCSFPESWLDFVTIRQPRAKTSPPRPARTLWPQATVFGSTSLNVLSADIEEPEEDEDEPELLTVTLEDPQNITCPHCYSQDVILVESYDRLICNNCQQESRVIF